MADNKIEFTPDLVKKQADLADLPDEKVTSIVTLANNVLNQAMKDKTKEYYDSTDKIFAEAGITREQTEHTNDLLRRVASKIKTVDSEISGYTSKIADLEKSIKEGNTDKATVKKLEEYEQKLADAHKTSDDWKKKYNTEMAAKDSEITKATQKNNEILVDVEFQKALSGVTFKDKSLLPEEDRNFLIEAKKTAILSKYTPDFIDDGKGGKMLVFRNADKSIVNNPEKGMNPMTAGDLLLKEITFALDTGHKASGSGSKPAESKQGAPITLNGAKTQIEADEVIRKHLVANGLDVTTTAFRDEALKLRKDLEVSKLPG